MRSVLVKPGALRIHSVFKVASSSIRTAAPQFDFVSADEPGPEYRFMVVRHPLDRIVSAWAYFVAPNENRLKGQASLRRIGARPGMDFPAFLQCVLGKGDMDKHTRSQAAFTGPHPIDRIIRLSALGREWGYLRACFPVLQALPDKPRNESLRGPWTDYYTKQDRTRAERVFAADMDLFEAAHG